jgi:phosphate:Na+ symporter
MIAATIAPFMAGLGLFFCGVHFIAANVTPLAGRRFRAILMRVADRPWLAAITGIVAGVITQSGNAVTYVVIGLVAGGILDKRRAILVPTWSHVGTSVLVILVAIDLRIAASYAVAIAGFAVYFGVSRSDRMRHAVNALLGAGLLFLGLEMLKSGAGPMRDLLVADGVMQYAAGAPALLFMFGTALTFLCQSSTVTSAIAVAAVNIGLIDFSGACWLVYGANFGSVANHYLLVASLSGEGRQIALMQIAQKLGGFACIFAILVASAIVGRPLIDMTVSLLASTAGGKVAWVFLFFQSFGALVCTIAFAPLLALLERVAPPTKLQELSKPAFLIDEALVEPSFAVDLVGREEQRLLQLLPTMLDGIRADGGKPEAGADLVESAGRNVTRAMAAYLESILGADVERSDRERIIRLQHRTANLGALFEALGSFVNISGNARKWPSSGRVADQMVEALHALLSALVDAAASDDAADRDFVLSLLGHRDELMERIRQRVMREDPAMPAVAQEALFTATMLFERIVWLARQTTMLLVPAAATTTESPRP